MSWLSWPLKSCWGNRQVNRKIHGSSISAITGFSSECDTITSSPREDVRDSDKVMNGFLENGFVNYGGYNQATKIGRACWWKGVQRVWAGKSDRSWFKFWFYLWAISILFVKWGWQYWWCTEWVHSKMLAWWRVLIKRLINCCYYSWCLRACMSGEMQVAQGGWSIGEWWEMGAPQGFCSMLRWRLHMTEMFSHVPKSRTTLFK